VRVCVGVCEYDCNAHCALNSCVKLQKSLGLSSQPFRGLNVTSPVFLACLILGEYKEKCECLQYLCLSHNAATPVFNPVLKHHGLICSLCRTVKRQRNTAISNHVAEEISNAHTSNGISDVNYDFHHRTLLNS